MKWLSSISWLKNNPFMDATVFSALISNISMLALLYHDFASQLDIDLEIVAFIISDEFFPQNMRTVFVNQ
jgi:hypothetical protein